MALPKIPAGVLVICIIFAIIGGLWGAHAAGLVNLNPVFSDLPFLGKYFAEEKNVENTITPLEEENNKLKIQVDKLEKELASVQTQLKNDTASYEDEIKGLNTQIVELEKQINALKDKESKSAKLAEYYSEMKPKSVVPIFDNLDDEIVLNILMKLSSDQASKILAELDPLRAAKLTKVLTDISNNVEN